MGGLRDAGQSTLDLLWDSTLINPISPLFFARVHAEIISDKPIGQAPNPIQMPEVSPPQTISGGITHGVSQFIVGFIPAVRATKFIKPLKNVGSWVKGMIAGSVTDFTVFSPHEERLSNLVQEFPELANPITEYLQAKPDDSFAEGRLKNSLEGIIAGGLAEPLTRSLRLLKYARIKITGTEVRAKVHHKIEAVEVELDEVNWNNVVETRTTHTGSEAGDYLNNFKPSSTPAELIQQQAGKGTQVTINTEHILNGEIKTYANGTKVGTGGIILLMSTPDQVALFYEIPANASCNPFCSHANSI